MTVSTIELKPVIENMLEELIVVGPALNAVGIGGLDKDTHELIEADAKDLTMKYWPQPGIFKTRPEVIIAPIEVQHGFTEILSSTSAYLSHLRLGYLQIDEAMIRVATRLLDKFIETYTFEKVMAINFLVNAYDDLQMLKHYKQVSVEDFTSGKLHRPWIHYTLQSEAEELIELGFAVPVDVHGIPNLQITDKGMDRFHELKQFLTNSGFIQRRNALFRFSQFGQFQDYDKIVEEIFIMNTLRKRLLELCEIKPGSEVLELGAGTGGLTYDAELNTLVGTTGQLVVTDPSFGMLQRAKLKEQQRGIGNVRFVQAAAEKIPVPDDSFDAVIGFSFLHFTDIPAVIKEVRRVLKPGGVFSTMIPLSPTYPRFLLECLSPLRELAPHAKNPDIAPAPDLVPKLLSGLFVDVFVSNENFVGNVSNPELFIQFAAASNVYEEHLNQLPWKAKQDLFELLVERGKSIILTNLVDPFIMHCQYIRGRVIK